MAAFGGFAASVAVVPAACQALGATDSPTLSWIAGLGAAFWALVAGLAALAIERAVAQVKQPS